mmetsp:Transcript_18910/g.36769  ORF Transcript_18910/g.36769 Transcript_18910/m.36769 type:complete len:214 (-) Transcript_18910:408-1049(-)
MRSLVSSSLRCLPWYASNSSSLRRMNSSSITSSLLLHIACSSMRVFSSSSFSRSMARCLSLNSCCSLSRSLAACISMARCASRSSASRSRTFLSLSSRSFSSAVCTGGGGGRCCGGLACCAAAAACCWCTFAACCAACCAAALGGGCDAEPPPAEEPREEAGWGEGLLEAWPEEEDEEVDVRVRANTGGSLLNTAQSVSQRILRVDSRFHCVR